MAEARPEQSPARLAGRLTLAVLGGTVVAFFLAVVLSPLWMLLVLALALANIGGQIFAISTRGPRGYRFALILINLVLFSIALIWLLTESLGNASPS
ncbi:hypothetical protein M3147_17065 [Agromyces mediolanus]|uniref:hypothetical protein n=1 Tax=Agromyces mediolanus TaxID=41986 RepID=UPI00203D56E0|nr:hypothetical protein [Agromyces mediolanus]MCM3658970.1 hypothetical protein [Agromyces mediolanus]